MSRKFKIIGIMLAVITGSVSAQTSLTLQDAMKIGQDNSKTLRISELAAEAAGERYSETNANRWASLSFQGRYTRLSSVPPFTVNFPPFVSNLEISPSVLNNYNLQLTVQQPIFTGFQLENASRAAEKSAEASSYDAKADRSTLKVQIATAYWNLYNAIQAREFMQENLDRTNLHYKQAQDMLNQGMLTQSDVLSVKVQVSNSQLMLLNAQNAERLAAVALNNVLGVPLNTEYRLSSVPQTGDTTAPAIDELLRTALENRDEIESMKLKAQAADAAVGAAWGAYLPQVALVGDLYYQRPNQRYMPTVDAFKNTWDASIVVSLNIWNWGQTESKVDEARAQREQADLALKQTADLVYLDVTQSYLNFRQAKDRISVAETAVKDAEESYRISDQKFKVGLVTNTDLKDSELALLQAKLNYSQALTDLEIARINLEKATGQL